MKELTFEEAVNNVFRYGADGSRYRKELEDFLSSPIQCAELDSFGATNANSACSCYRKVAKTYGFSVKVVERSGKVIAYKKQTYDLPSNEIRASNYADRIINYVAEEEARQAFMSQWDY